MIEQILKPQTTLAHHVTSKPLATQNHVSQSVSPNGLQMTSILSNGASISNNTSMLANIHHLLSNISQLGVLFQNIGARQPTLENLLKRHLQPLLQPLLTNTSPTRPLASLSGFHTLSNEHIKTLLQMHSQGNTLLDSNKDRLLRAVSDNLSFFTDARLHMVGKLQDVATVFKPTETNITGELQSFTTSLMTNLNFNHPASTTPNNEATAQLPKQNTRNFLRTRPRKTPYDETPRTTKQTTNSKKDSQGSMLKKLWSGMRNLIRALVMKRE